MTRNIKIIILWLTTVCGFACHSICDVLPMFWGKDMAVMDANGNVDQGMIVFMMTLSFLVPCCGLLCMMFRKNWTNYVNVALACIIALFNVAHLCMEIPSDNAGQYVILPLMVVVGFILAYQSVKAIKEE